MKNLAGKMAFVTGAAGGLGTALSRSLAEAGAHVAMADIDPDRIPDLPVPGARAARIALDVTDPDAWTKALEEAESKLGPISILVHNAGLGQIAPVANESLDRWRRTFEVNAFGPFYGCRAALPRMMARSEAHIVIVASQSGLTGSPGMAAYTASKHAAVGLARSLRLELQDSSVGVSLVCPGMVRTGLVSNSMQRLATDIGVQAPSADVTAAAATALEMGMDPAKVAARVLRAIRDDQFYVFTHAGFAEKLGEQAAEMIEASRESADPDYQEPADISQFRSRAEIKS